MPSETKSLFDAVKVGRHTLKCRVVMPPLTRARSTQPGDIPNDIMATYYSQRASAGLIVSEGTQISQLGKGYAKTPGIYTKEQVEGWKKVTAAVHKEGGIMFSQLWHVGRVSHPSNTGGLQPISASAIAAKNVKVFSINDKGEPEFVPTATPRAMTHEDIKTVVGEYKQAAQNALDAGFDGVELHAANGYLINQFIDSESNERTDEYGGSIENRTRFLGMVVDALVSVMGSDRVGVRLAPFTTLNGTVDKEPGVTYPEVGKLMNSKGVAYLHIAEVDWADAPGMPLEFRLAMRAAFKNTIIYTGLYTFEKADAAIKAGYADCIGFGRPFIANPDLPDRLKNGYPIAEPDASTFYNGTSNGLIDYPKYSAAVSAATATADTTSSTATAAKKVDSDVTKKTVSAAPPVA